MVEGKFGVCNGITRVNDVKSGWVTLGIMSSISVFTR